MTMMPTCRTLPNLMTQGFAMFKRCSGPMVNFKIYGELDGSASAVSIKQRPHCTFGEEEAYIRRCDVRVLVNQDMEISDGRKTF